MPIIYVWVESCDNCNKVDVSYLISNGGTGTPTKRRKGNESEDKNRDVDRGNDPDRGSVRMQG